MENPVEILERGGKNRKLVFIPKLRVKGGDKK